MVKVTFVAKEPGFYKIVFSNGHSWFREKQLGFRYVVLKPVISTEVQIEEPEEQEKEEPQKIEEQQEEIINKQTSSPHESEEEQLTPSKF